MAEGALGPLQTGHLHNTPQQQHQHNKSCAITNNFGFSLRKMNNERIL
jgi:hypothetical protein